MSIVLRNMTPIRRTCFPLFSLMQFVAWLIPWPWACDSWIYSQAPRETSSRGESTILEAQTDESLLVNDNDLKYLTREEAEKIIERFKQIPQSYNRLVFWTGIPREWVQQWADDHSMLTLTSAMGPLMDRKDQRCLRRIKKPKKWSKYIKGASIIFARYACTRGIVRVLTLPPSWAEFIRPRSTYRTIEEPILKGASGCCCALQIRTVHLLTTLEELEYQTWPQSHIPEKLTCRGIGSPDFRLPRWTRKAVKAATKSLRSNCVSSAVLPTPTPANVSVVLEASVRTTSGPQSIEQPNGGKQSKDSLSAQGHSRLQSQRPEDKKRPQTQQTSSKKTQPQTQQMTSKKKQAQTQQPQSKKQRSKKKQPQNQQPQSKEQRSQTQLSQSKNQQLRSQQLQSKNQQPQTQQLSSKQQQPQNQQPQSKKPQP